MSALHALRLAAAEQQDGDPGTFRGQQADVLREVGRVREIGREELDGFVEQAAGRDGDLAIGADNVFSRRAAKDALAQPMIEDLLAAASAELCPPA